MIDIDLTLIKILIIHILGIIVSVMLCNTSIYNDSILSMLVQMTIGLVSLIAFSISLGAEIIKNMFFGGNDDDDDIGYV